MFVVNVTGYNMLDAPFLYNPRTFAVTIVSRVSLISADLLVLLATWYRSYATVKLFHQNRIRGQTLASVLLRDGA